MDTRLTRRFWRVAVEALVESFVTVCSVAKISLDVKLFAFFGIFYCPIIDGRDFCLVS